LREGEGELRIAFLLEHKSSRPTYPHLQLLRYMSNIWQENIKQKVALKLVIPIIFYHGTKDYEYRPLESYFPAHNNRFRQFVPEFTYILVNFKSYSDRQIKEQLFKRDSNKVLILFMKHIFDKEYIKCELGSILKIGVFYYTTEEGKKFFICILHYIFQSTGEISEEAVIEKVQNAIPGGGRIAMTIAEKLRKEGRKEGLKEGLKETARKMLQKGYPLGEIAELTGLDLETIKGLGKEQA
jgi:predicted transposase/invertase (TIGR01784 family)